MHACTVSMSCSVNQSALLQGTTAGSGPTGTGSEYTPTGTGAGYGATNTGVGHHAQGNPPLGGSNTGYNNPNSGYNNDMQSGHHTQPTHQGYSPAQAKTGHADDGVHGSTAPVSMCLVQSPLPSMGNNICM